MIIQCEECRTRFNIDGTLLKNEGSKVRCSLCKHVFVAYPPDQTGAEEPLPASIDQEELEYAKLLTWATNGKLYFRIWDPFPVVSYDLETGEIQEIPTPGIARLIERGYSWVTISPDGSHVAYQSGDDFEKITIFDVENETILLELDNSLVTSKVTFSPCFASSLNRSSTPVPPSVFFCCTLYFNALSIIFHAIFSLEAAILSPFLTWSTISHAQFSLSYNLCSLVLCLLATFITCSVNPFTRVFKPIRGNYFRFVCRGSHYVRPFSP